MIVIEWGPPFRWLPRFERAGPIRFRVQFAWVAVSYIQTRNLSTFIEDVAKVGAKTSASQ